MLVVAADGLLRIDEPNQVEVTGTGTRRPRIVAIRGPPDQARHDRGRANPDLVTTREFRYQGDAIVEEKVTDPAHPTGAIVRTYTVTEAGQIVSMTIPAGEPSAGTYLPTWNGHGDALALWRQETNGTLTVANSYTYATWGTPATTTHNGIADLGFRFLNNRAFPSSSTTGDPGSSRGLDLGL